MDPAKPGNRTPAEMPMFILTGGVFPREKRWIRVCTLVHTFPGIFCLITDSLQEKCHDGENNEYYH